MTNPVVIEAFENTMDTTPTAMAAKVSNLDQQQLEKLFIALKEQIDRRFFTFSNHDLAYHIDSKKFQASEVQQDYFAGLYTHMMRYIVRQELEKRANQSTNQ